jgi:Multiubiquitin
MSNQIEQSINEKQHDREHTIIVNGRPKKWTEDEISFEQLVQLAFPEVQPNPNTAYTVT